MKNFIRYLPIKIICFILCIMFLLLSAAGMFGIFWKEQYKYSNLTEEEAFQTRIQNILYNDGQELCYMARAHATAPYFDEYYGVTESNIRYIIYHTGENGETKKIAGNIQQNMQPWEHAYRYYDIDGRVNEIALDSENEADTYTVFLYLEKGLPSQDLYANIRNSLKLAYSIDNNIYLFTAIALAVTTALFITLMCVSARKPESEELHPGLLNRIPFDALLLISAAILLFISPIMTDAPHLDQYSVLLLSVGTVISIAIFLGICMSISARLKQHNLLKNTVCWKMCLIFKRFFKWIWSILKELPSIWKTVLLVMGAIFIELIFLFVVRYQAAETVVFLWFAKNAVFAFLILYAAIIMRKLQKGSEALAKGDLSYKTDTEKLFLDFKLIGENLNNISIGMARAVEERLASERTKAELITNVSHDLKTPLTSIIGYAGLIAENECENEKHKEYSEVLIRKSERLKRLLEDIVEISKVTSGNLEVALLPCHANVLLTQVSGEFQEKCETAKLELITDIPDEILRINADSRRIWRVFENLMSNICKYSLPHSRVYLNLEKQGEDAVFIFRNTSKNPLNISPNELMERFVRGDESRTTEGNGLGLSIAQSLTELQNGKMDISIDGDLFKVVLKFPLV